MALLHATSFAVQLFFPRKLQHLLGFHKPFQEELSEATWIQKSNFLSNCVDLNERTNS